MDLFNRKKIKKLQEDVNVLKIQNEMLIETVKRIKENIDNLWIATNYNNHQIKCLPEMKRCLGCPYIGTDETDSYICKTSGKPIFEITDNECPKN